MQLKNNHYGLVVCGGKSIRMGSDKGLLAYHEKPQRYYLYEMLDGLCEKTFISCNASQKESVDGAYPVLIDLPLYSSIGPMAALLTAFTNHPTCDFLVVGCDYPFVTFDDLKKFLTSRDKATLATAFYNEEQQFYEPLLAWYSHRTANTLMKLFEEKEYSLQYFLQSINAQKYYASDVQKLRSVDTPELMIEVKALLANKMNSQ